MLGHALRLLPPERAHKVAVQGLAGVAGLLPQAKRFYNLYCDPGLGKPMPSPLGLAAGFDKDAVAIKGCFKLGFGAVEVGSITPKPQPGNPQPRVFRLTDDRGIINRYGFNSLGSDVALGRLAKLKRKYLPGPLGINLGKNKTAEALDDYRTGMQQLAAQGDYVTINLSSPNTPGLRDQQNLDAVEALIEGLEDVWPDKPVLVKLAPDLVAQDLGALVDLLASGPVAGIIMGNTTLTRPQSLVSMHRNQAGGLSGAPLFALALEKLKSVASANLALPADRRLIIVGCGGVDSALSALKMIRHGASVVQLYSALVYHGPSLINQINAEMSAILDADGVQSINDLVGIDLK